MSLSDMPDREGYHRLTDVDGRRYTLALPAGFIPTQAYPLILALHYGGPVSPWYGAGLLQSLVEPGLRALGAIMVAPDCQHGGWNNAASEAAVSALLEQMDTHYEVTPDQTLITGYSMGGIGTWHLGSQLQNRFSVAIPMAAPRVSLALQTDWQIPLYVLHGEHDELFPYADTAAFIQELRLAGTELEFATIAGATHYAFGGFVKGLAALVPTIQRYWQVG